MINRLVLFFALAGATVAIVNWLNDNLNDALGASIFILLVIAFLVLYDDK